VITHEAEAELDGAEDRGGEDEEEAEQHLVRVRARVRARVRGLGLGSGSGLVMKRLSSACLGLG
jgi:hypothetical protein